MSSSLDDIAPSFRLAKDRWPDAPNIQTHYNDLAQTFELNGSSLIELCKSFIEMICKTIIKELNKKPPESSRPTTTECLVCTLDALGIRNQRGSSALGTILSGYNKLSNGLANIRNQEGSVAHGKDGFIDDISQNHTRIYLLSADAIISLLLKAYDGVEPSIIKTRESHLRFLHYNEKIDSATQVEAQIGEDGLLEVNFHAGFLQEGLNLRIPASELLYYHDRHAYVDILDALRIVTIKRDRKENFEHISTEIAEMSIKEKNKRAKLQKQDKWPQKLKLINEYDGKFKDLVKPLNEFIINNIFDGDKKKYSNIKSFSKTILNKMEDFVVVDWSKRNIIRTKVRLFIKKLVKLYSIEKININSIEKIIDWLSLNINEGGN